MESNIRALVLLHLFNSVKIKKKDKMLSKPNISSFFPSCLINSTRGPRSPDLLNNVKIGQGQLRLFI